MSLEEARSQYIAALKRGQKYQKACVSSGQYPYPLVLDEIFNEANAVSRQDLGIVNVPIPLIIGTKTAGRRIAFSGNFLPLLSADSEFATKWISLCSDHLGETGIREPIKCYEYLGKFYVEEGNKRVSVLASYDAATIPAHVIRLVPAYSEEPDIRAYYEFMNFYRLAGSYQLQLRESGDYAKLQARLGYANDHVWTNEERLRFSALFSRFDAAWQKLNTEKLPITAAAALLIWLRLYKLPEIETLTAAELNESILTVLPDIRLVAQGKPISILTEAQQTEPGLISRLIPGALPSHLNIAFIYAHAPDRGVWTKNHELGREHIERVFGEKITVRSYIVGGTGEDAAEEALEKAAEDGAQVIFATVPPLLGACCRLAVKHPEIRILNNALSVPVTGVRSYYLRLYEAKFITGAIAALMSGTDTIGYVADYPILGVPASINAYALGAQLTRPGTKVKLTWSCLPGAPAEQLTRSGVDVISNRDPSAEEFHPWIQGFGTYLACPDGSSFPLSTAVMNWGILYEKVIRSIFAGTWSSAENAKAISYYWGMDSDALGILLNPLLPDGVKRLAEILSRGIRDGSLSPFDTPICDQSGALRHDGHRLSADEIIHMDWLCSHVEGRIPAFDELLPMSQKLTRLLGIYRDQIPPEEEDITL